MTSDSEANLRLVVDVSHNFQTGMTTGIQRVLKQFVSSLKKQNREFILVWHPYGSRETFYDVTDYFETMSSSFFHRFYKNYIQKYSFKFTILYKLQSILFNLSAFKKLIDKLKLGKLLSEGLFKYNEEKRDVLILIDVFWHDNTLIDQIFNLNNQGLRVLTFIHDLFPLTNPEWFEKKSVSQFTRNMNVAISISNGLITSSEMNYHEIEKYIFKKFRHRSQTQLTRLNLGVDHLEPQKNYKTNSKKGLIWVGTIEPRKNVKLLIEFIEFYNPKFPIFVIGKIGWKSFDEVNHLRRLNKAKKITWLQNCSDEELIEVISKCEIGLITSINEGYGFPVYEFLNLKLRVIAPNIQVFSEQKIEGIEFYEPNNIHDLAKICLSENINTTQLDLNKLPSWNNFTKLLWDFALKM